MWAGVKPVAHPPVAKPNLRVPANAQMNLRGYPTSSVRHRLHEETAPPQWHMLGSGGGWWGFWPHRWPPPVPHRLSFALPQTPAGHGRVMKQRILSYAYSPRDTGYTVAAQASAECCLKFAHWAIECCIGCLESAYSPPSEPGQQLASTSTTTTTQPPLPLFEVTVYCTTHAHLVHMCWPLSWALHQMGHSFATFGTYALVVCWMNHMGTASTQKSLHLCSLCLHQWRVPQFALKYPCNPPPPPGDRHLATVSPPQTRETIVC